MYKINNISLYQKITKNNVETANGELISVWNGILQNMTEFQSVTGHKRISCFGSDLILVFPLICINTNIYIYRADTVIQYI